MPLVQKTQARVSSPGPPEMARADPRPLQIRARCRSAAIKDDQFTRAEQVVVDRRQSLTRQQLGLEPAYGREFELMFECEQGLWVRHERKAARLGCLTYRAT